MSDGVVKRTFGKIQFQFDGVWWKAPDGLALLRSKFNCDNRIHWCAYFRGRYIGTALSAPEAVTLARAWQCPPKPFRARLVRPYYNEVHPNWMRLFDPADQLLRQKQVIFFNQLASALRDGTGRNILVLPL